MDRTNPSKYMKRSERLILPSEETNALTSTDSGTEELSKMAKKDEREEEDSKKPQEHEKYACPYTFNDFVVRIYSLALLTKDLGAKFCIDFSRNRKREEHDLLRSVLVASPPARGMC